MASGSIQWAAPNHCIYGYSKKQSSKESQLFFATYRRESERGTQDFSFLTPETSTNAEGATVWKKTTRELKTAFKAYC